MDKWTFGITMAVVGVAATFLTLWVLSLVMTLLKKIFPLSPEETKTDKKT
jgi:Na+-transporting methylmalonyl-CoA/oxaloacetate decarboxylase gamma subunit